MPQPTRALPHTQARFKGAPYGSVVNRAYAPRLGPSKTNSLRLLQPPLLPHSTTATLRSDRTTDPRQSPAMDGFGGVGADGGRQSPSTTPSPPPGAIQLQVSPPGRRPLGQQQTQQQQQPMTDGAGPSPSYYASLAPYETFDEEDAAVGAAVGGGQQHQQQAPAASAAERVRVDVCGWMVNVCN